MYGSGRALSVSIQDSDTSSLFQSRILSPIKSKDGLRTHRMLTNKLTSMVANKTDNFDKEQGTNNLNNYTTEQLEQIKKIHEIHFNLKKEQQKL